MMSFIKYGFPVLLSLSAALPAHAADTRKVSEPITPNICSIVQPAKALSTQVIQNALNACSPGKAVRLSSNGSNNVFVSGPLSMPSGVSLVIDRGVVLRADNRGSTFDKGKKTCGTISGDGKGCHALITFEKVSNAGIYGEGEIDGQGGRVLSDQTVSWWDLAQRAKTLKAKQNAPRLIQINSSENITLHKITMKNSPNFHVVFYKSNGLTAWKVTIDTPGTARNTDGIDPISSKNVTVAHSYISTGDDNVAIKANPKSGSSSNMSFINNNFGLGHGMSIGSETVDSVYNIDVDGLVMNGTKNGLRIKSDKSASGEVFNVRYNNVKMTNVKNAIMMDTIYENKSGSTKANWHDVTYNDVTVVGKSNIIFEGANAVKPLHATMTNMKLSKDIVWKINNANIKR